MAPRCRRSVLCDMPHDAMLVLALTRVAVAPQYTMEEIGRHNKPDDLWLVVDNRVYDVSKWAKHHPGGHLCMENVAGADATDAFENYHPAYVQPPGLVVFRQWLLKRPQQWLWKWLWKRPWQ